MSKSKKVARNADIIEKALRKVATHRTVTIASVWLEANRAYLTNHSANRISRRLLEERSISIPATKVRELATMLEIEIMKPPANAAGTNSRGRRTAKAIGVVARALREFMEFLEYPVPEGLLNITRHETIKEDASEENSNGSH